MQMHEKIRRLRRGRALNQHELARLAALSQSTLSQIESGEVKEPHPRTLGKLATALGVSAFDLLDDED